MSYPARAGDKAGGVFRDSISAQQEKDLQANVVIHCR